MFGLQLESGVGFAILTYPLKRTHLKEELAFFAEHMRACGHTDCEVLFGFVWGNEYYETDHWDYERIPLHDLVDKVEQVEAMGLGQLGQDDLFVKVPGFAIEFQFCHDSDIHITYESAGEVTEFFYQRWNSRGFSPAEWLVDPHNLEHKRLRFN